MRTLVPAIFCILFGCASDSARNSSRVSDVTPIRFDLEYGDSDSTYLHVHATPDRVKRLNEAYKTLRVEFGPVVNGVQMAQQQGHSGKMELPWTIRLSGQVRPPFPARLVGTTKTGDRVVIYETDFSDR